MRELTPNERQRLLDYLDARGWTAEDAEILVDHGRGTLTFAAVLFNEAVYRAGMTILRTFADALPKGKR